MSGENVVKLKLLIDFLIKFGIHMRLNSLSVLVL